MEDDDSTYLVYSDAVGDLLSDNHVEISDLIRDSGVPAEFEWRVNPVRSRSDSATRELVSVLLGVSALVTALTPVLKRSIEALAHKSVVVEEVVLVPVLDGNGEPVRDANDQPVLHWMNRKRFVETEHDHTPSHASIEISATGLRLYVEDES
jgi:hypothetical protein